MNLATIRDDLKEIRYYYTKKKMFDEAFECTGQSEIIQKVKKYNEMIVFAPIKLYELYHSLYIKNHTQESLSEELCYTPEYVQMLHKQLLKFLQSRFAQLEGYNVWFFR